MTVYPYLLKEYRNRWFLFASKSEDMALQTLALDRIVSIEVVEDIPWRENPDFDTEYYFDDITTTSTFFLYSDRKRLPLPLSIYEQVKSRKYECQDKCRKGMAPQADHR